MSEEEILKGLADAVVNGDAAACEKFAKEALNAGVDPYKALMEGCAKGMDIMSDKYECREAFVPDILLSAQAIYKAIDILKPHIKMEATETPGKVVLGVVEGDIHDIGKNIVKILLDVAGFEIIDLGRDVRLKQFIEKVREEKPDILGMSALMSTSMIGMPHVLEMLQDAGVREDLMVMVGGGPLSSAYAEEIGAEGYAENAPQAVKLAGELVRMRKRRRTL